MANELVGNDDTWPEIMDSPHVAIGEQLRGGATVAGDSAYAVLGELMEKSPALKSYIEKRIASSRPVLHRLPVQKARDWQIDLPATYGTAGSATTVTVNPQCLFRGEKIMATDTALPGGPTTAVPAGYGTTVGTILIGNRLQRPAGSGATLTAFFANNALGNGVKWDTCEKALSIAITVNFINSCTFYMTVYGKAVLS